MSAPQFSPVELEVGRIRELSRGRRYQEALAAAEALAPALPHHRDVLYLIAANQRCLNRIPEALATLERLEQHHPGFSLLYQERGHCYVTLRDAPRAIDAFQRAVTLNPSLAASWTMLERLHHAAGDYTNSAKAAGLHVEALRLLARTGRQRGALDEAELLLEEALQLAPHDRAARLDYVRILIDRQEYGQARDAVDGLLKLDPSNPDYLLYCAAVSAGLGQHDHAIALYRELLVSSSGSAELHVLLGHSLKAVGRQKEAIESYRAAAEARPGFGDAYWSLANLKTYRFSPGEIAHMRTQEAALGVEQADHYHLCFALGKAYEDRNQFAESWQYYERGNSLKHAECRYDPAIAETNARLQIEVCTPQFFAARAGAGAPDPDPVFIVGLPRSGSTLVDQVLSSHSQVDGTQELYDIQRIVIGLRGRESGRPLYPGVLAGLSSEDFRRLGERYIADTRAYRQGKPFFVDKTPNNFHHIGLIHLILPNAKIIDVRREPMACCFGNLKQLFAAGQEFAYSIANLARYYRTYLDLMRHWDAVLPCRVLRVWYEDVVDDLHGNVRRILEFCGLEFEPACLEFYKTLRSVRTASSEQVRQPIFRQGLHQWKNYESWLASLQDALGDALTRYRE